MRVVLVDPALANEAGHYLNYALAVRGEICRRGHEVALAGNREISAELAARFGIHGTFLLGHVERDEEAARLIQPRGGRLSRLLASFVPVRGLRRRLRAELAFPFAVQRVQQDFEAVAAALTIGASDLMIVNSLQARETMALAAWTASRPVSACPEVAVVLHYAAVEDDVRHASAAYRWRRLASRIAGQLHAEKLHFFADTQHLASAFGALLRRPVGLVPIPHVEASSRQRQPGPPRAVFLGGGTVAKGFHLLPDIVRALEPEVRAGRLRFAVHINLDDPSPEVRAAAEALRDLDVERAEGKLDEASYRQLLVSGDILLQPHDPARYAVQSSGVFAEGRGLGLVAIVPEGTTMAEEITRRGGGFIVGEWTSAAYAAGVRTALADWPRLAGEAEKVAGAWAATNSSAGFCEAVNGHLPPSHRL